MIRNLDCNWAEADHRLEHLSKPCDRDVRMVVYALQSPIDQPLCIVLVRIEEDNVIIFDDSTAGSKAFMQSYMHALHDLPPSPIRHSL